MCRQQLGMRQGGKYEYSQGYYHLIISKHDFPHLFWPIELSVYVKYLAIANDQLIGDTKTSKALMDIYNEDKKLIKGAFMFAWDGESGDSEYCLRYPTYVYFNTGEKMVLSYDYTD